MAKFRIKLEKTIYYEIEVDAKDLFDAEHEAIGMVISGVVAPTCGDCQPDVVQTDLL